MELSRSIKAGNGRGNTEVTVDRSRLEAVATGRQSGQPDVEVRGNAPAVVEARQPVLHVEGAAIGVDRHEEVDVELLG